MNTLHKKADSGINFVMITAVIAIFCIILLIVWLGTFYIGMKERNEVQNCKNSVTTHMQLTEYTKRTVFSDIKCPTRDILVKTDSEYKSKKQIAEDMYRCWYEWNKGEGDLFKGEGTFCHICSIYTFENPATDIHDFEYFLAKEQISNRYEYNAKMSYYEYLGYGGTAEVSEVLKIDETPREASLAPIEASKKYASVVVYMSEKDFFELIIEGKNRPGVAVGGGLLATGGTLATIALASNPGGWLVAAVGATAIGATIAWKALFPEDPRISFKGVIFTEYNAESLKSLGCEYIETNQLSHTQQS